MEVLQARELLEANLALVGRAVAFACRRYRFDSDDAEEFASVVNVKLVDGGYAVLRSYQGRSGLSTYLSTVIQHWALDYRIHEWGKWHPSAEARRMGAAAVDLEQLLHRDGRTVEEALPLLAAKHPDVTLDSLKKLAASLPRRPPRRHDVPVEEAGDIASTGPRDIEDQARAGERRRTAAVVAKLVKEAVAKLSDDDRLILQLCYEQGLSVAQIARALQRDQKFLYRQIDRCKKQLRDEILRSGLVPADVLDLIGRDDAFLSFGLGNDRPRPSKECDERAATEPEDPE